MMCTVLCGKKKKNMSLLSFTNAELRAWQQEFMTWLDTKNQKKIVNLCGGSWGKTWMVNYLRSLYPSRFSVFHSILDDDQDVDEMDDFLTNTAKVALDFEAQKTVVVVTLEPLKTHEYRNDIVYYALRHLEPEADVFYS